MTIAPGVESATLPPLDYTRTVDRLLVHRDALGEVFLTDLQKIDEDHYAAAAQLPRSHAYYGDHLLRPSAYDPLLVLESCRQAALAGAHRFYGVPADSKFILTQLRLRLHRPQIFLVGEAPFALAMRIRIVDRRERDGRTTGLDYEIDLVDSHDVVIGQAAIGLRFKTPTGYLTLRLNNRHGLALPSSSTYPVSSPGHPVPPHLVGRHNPENVVLVDAAVADGSAHALLRIPAAHASMFDHPQDHLPGMVITEGARQLALFAALDVEGMSTSKTLVTEMDVVFSRFGELEDDTVLTAWVDPFLGNTPRGDSYTLGGPLPAEDTWALPQRLPVRVEATQKGEALCTYSLVLARISV
ncbi:ScbA/BarX family gamma-butyrolactone biosynthesis protein [Streptomyces sp. NPDC006458]|uniref:ScbA/BarX family gamma-butyrolactone biosynthesis protein n=1 Tax=Streptomyces sp. NPDC006458 TaxID=3154302 RepID=UPI0033B0F583